MICEKCQKEFTPVSAHQKYCSPACARAMKLARDSARRKAKYAESKKRTKIKKSLDHLDKVCLEINEYNQKHHTHYGYGDYQVLKFFGKWNF